MTSPLRSAVRSTWLSSNRGHEGRYGCMYLDSKAIVTTAVGYRIANANEAVGLPWVDTRTGTRATELAIRDEYKLVAGMHSLAKAGADTAMKVTFLRLSEADIDRLSHERLDQMVRHLVEQFPAFPSWPADVQWALCSIAWAAGSQIAPTLREKGWPRLTGHLQREDFTSAADEVKLDETKTDGVVNRNLATRAHMLAGAAVVARGADPERIYGSASAVPAESATEQDAGPSREAREAYATSVLGTRAWVDEMARRGRRDD